MRYTAEAFCGPGGRRYHIRDKAVPNRYKSLCGGVVLDDCRDTMIVTWDDEPPQQAPDGICSYCWEMLREQQEANG